MPKKVKVSEKSSEEKDSKKNKKMVWVSPCPACDDACSDEDEDFSKLEFELPGVKKEDIHLHIARDRMRLAAKRDDEIIYFNESILPCDAVPDSIKAEYDNGLLMVDIPLMCEDLFQETSAIEIS